MGGLQPPSHWLDSQVPQLITGLQLGCEMGLINDQPSGHFTWEEAAVTTHREVENIIPDRLRPVIRYTADRMEAVRGLLGVPIHVLSWYRSSELNAAVGGSRTSQHMEGCAVDFHAPQFGIPRVICERLVRYSSLILFDQLILEHTWVHISFNAIPNGKPRLQVLTLLQDKTYASGLTDKFGTSIA